MRREVCRAISWIALILRHSAGLTRHSAGLVRHSAVFARHLAGLVRQHARNILKTNGKIFPESIESRESLETGAGSPESDNVRGTPPAPRPGDCRPRDPSGREQLLT